MPKVKIPRKSTTVDMTAMTDVAFLLLTFFMLATQFKPEEPVKVNAPASIAETLLPDKNMMTITIADDSRVFFELQGKQYKQELLKKMADERKMTFSNEEINSFSLLSSFGVPLNQLKSFLDIEAEARTKIAQPGIPWDSTNNELADWLRLSRHTNKDVMVAIKGDENAGMPVIKQIMTTLQQKNINIHKFNFITNLSVETVENK